MARSYGSKALVSPSVPNAPPTKKRPTRKLAAKKPRESQSLRFMCRCTTPHRINGVTYGPGMISAPPDLANELMWQEQQIVASEHRFANPPAFIFGPGGVKRSVNPETFDEALGGAGPSIQFSGGGTV